MIVISMLLVVVGFVTLMLGVLNVGVGDFEPLSFVYVSIGACVLAAVFLIIGVVRGRPSRKPVMASGGDSQEASWSGASSWERETAEPQEQAPPAQPAPADAETRVQVVTAPADAEDAPTDAETSADEWAPGTTEDDDVVVVPKRTAAERSTADAPAAAKKSAKKAGAKKSAKKSAKKAAAKKSAKKAGAKKSAKKAGAKKSAKKAAAKKSMKGATQKISLAAPEDVTAKLAEVSGVGPAKREALLEHFGNASAIAAASVDQLAEVEGVSPQMAERIHKRLRS